MLDIPDMKNKIQNDLFVPLTTYLFHNSDDSNFFCDKHGKYKFLKITL